MREAAAEVVQGCSRVIMHLVVALAVAVVVAVVEVIHQTLVVEVILAQQLLQPHITVSRSHLEVRTLW
jgi:hypothetical protein